MFALLTLLQDLPDPTIPGAEHLAIAGLIAVGLVQGFKKLLPFIDRQSDIVKGIFAFVVSFGVAKFSVLLGVDLPGDLHNWGAVAFNAVAIWLEAMGVHIFVKKAVAQVRGVA